MVSLVAFIFVFGVLIFVHEFGHFIVAKKNGVRVEKFSFGFGKKLFSKKIGETEYLICAIPLGGYIKMAGDEWQKDRKGLPDEFLSKTCGQRTQIIAAGPILNYILAFFIFGLIYIIGSPVATSRIGELMDDYPAKEAGLKEQDLILAVDGERVEYWPDMSALIHQKTEGDVILDVQRGDQILQLSVTPLVEEHEDIFGQKMKIGLIGVYPSGEMVKIQYGWGRSFYEGAKKLKELTAITYKALWYLVIRRLSFRDSITGPIGIFYFTGEAARMGFVYLLNLMGLLSMSLAIFNFLPVPVLDGGHLFFLFLEKLRKKPVSAKAQERAHQIGSFALVSLMLFVFYSDLIKFGVFDKATELWQTFSAK